MVLFYSVVLLGGFGTLSEFYRYFLYSEITVLSG